MIIAVDHDEVLVPLVKPMKDWHNRKYGTSLAVVDFATYRFWEAWGGTREEAIHKYFDFVNSDAYMEVQPMPGALEVLQQLKEEGHSPIVVTSNQNEIIDRVKERLERHFSNIIVGVYNANHFSLEGPRRTKAEICEEQKADCLVDDMPSHLIECLSIVKLRILFGIYRWNCSSDLRFRRAFHWGHVKTIISAGARN